MMGWYGGGGWGGWWVISLLVVIFWGLVIFGGIAAWRAIGRGDRGQRQAARPTPEQLLDGRFARGELSEAEYRHHCELLRTGR